MRITKKNFEDEEMPDKLLLTARQKTKIRNAFADNKSANIKLLSKAHLSKIIQWNRFLG